MIAEELALGDLEADALERLIALVGRARSGCAKYSLSRVRCSCGIQNAFETVRASIAAVGHASSAKRGRIAPIEDDSDDATDGDRRRADQMIAVVTDQLDRVRVRAQHDAADVLKDLHERIEGEDVARPDRQDRDRVHDRRGEEERRRATSQIWPMSRYRTYSVEAIRRARGRRDRARRRAAREAASRDRASRRSTRRRPRQRRELTRNVISGRHGCRDRDDDRREPDRAASFPERRSTEASR